LWDTTDDDENRHRRSNGTDKRFSTFYPDRYCDRRADNCCRDHDPCSAPTIDLSATTFEEDLTGFIRCSPARGAMPAFNQSVAWQRFDGDVQYLSNRNGGRTLLAIRALRIA